MSIYKSIYSWTNNLPGKYREDYIEFHIVMQLDPSISMSTIVILTR